MTSYLSISLALPEPVFKKNPFKKDEKESVGSAKYRKSVA
jgi:hypothetical protein